MGLRQLRHPVQGVRHARHPGTVQEKIADAAQVQGSPGWRRRWRCTSRGTRSTTTPRCARYAEDLGVRLGTINSNTFQDDDYKLGSLTHADTAVRRKAIDHNLECIEVMDADRLARPEDLARRRHQLPRPGRHARPAGLAGRSAAPDLRPARRRPAAGAGVQVLRAGVLPHRRPGLGHVVRPRAPPSATGPWSASTPATTRPAPTSSSSSRSCCGSGSSARSTSTAASTPTTT